VFQQSRSAQAGLLVQHGMASMPAV
jgi:hypothetical protein